VDTTLVFDGAVASGIGKHADLHVPGRGQISQAPADWPLILFKGSLNVRIEPNGYPAFFSNRGLTNKVSTLDQNCFPCSFEIRYDQFGNNQLTPTAACHRRGSAQVWRAFLDANNHRIACWVLRRYGSTLIDVLELVSDKSLRATYGLEDNQRAIVVLQSGASAI
jgi:CTP-dependent riboflavin kinase